MLVMKGTCGEEEKGWKRSDEFSRRLGFDYLENKIQNLGNIS